MQRLISNPVNQCSGAIHCARIYMDAINRAPTGAMNCAATLSERAQVMILHGLDV